MRAAMIGGDERFRHAAQRLAQMGHDARWLGKWPDEEMDAILVQREEQIDGSKFGLCFVQRGVGSRKNVIYLDNEEEYLQANAFLTAEGALQAVMGVDGRAIFGAKCLVTGYGRIARALVSMLRSMNADVVAAVRPGKSADRAKTDGVDCVGTEELAERIGEFDYIWNTVPERILRKEELAAIKKGAGLFELASAPFGFDMEEARMLDIWTECLSGLPGKYCPDTAGRVVAQTIERIWMEKKGDFA